jgi:hypothetical protein
MPLKQLSNEFKGYASSRPEYVDCIVLAASSAESFTVPSGAKSVLLTGNYDFFANFATTAAIPTTEISNGASSFLVNSPRLILIEKTTAISVISDSVCTITAEFYK